MEEIKILTQRFEENRAHLRAVAYRMLGSSSEAEDAVQEAWLRLAGSDPSSVENLRGWLTTVVARICLDMLRTRKTRRELPIDPSIESIAAANDPARETEIADSVALAMLVVLETLTPAERVAFVLHDMFNLPFDDIAKVLGRSPVAARQLASRARRRVQGVESASEADRYRQREAVEAFLAAARGEDFSALLAILDPNVVLRADATAVALSRARAAAGAPIVAPEMRGPESVIETFKGRARAAQVAQVDGDYGVVFAPGGKPLVVFDFVIDNGRVIEISLIADRQSIGGLELKF